jgi:putative two-component system response regulator
MLSATVKNQTDRPGAAGVPRILLVDDCPDSIRLLGDILQSDYEILVATDGERALKIAHQNPGPDLIMLDIMMPGMGGYEVCWRLKTNPTTSGIPVIFITALAAQEDECYGFCVGAVDYITKPFNISIVRARVSAHITLHDQNLELQCQVEEHFCELQQAQIEIIKGLGRAARFKDDETGFHVIRMSHYSRILAEEMQMSKRWSQLLLHTASMHDVGKIGVPDAILTKPGKLDEEEWKVMKRHCQYGVDILGDHPSELVRTAKLVAYTHHERWDGNGYPRGLKGKEIPVVGRIVAVADVFDALTSKRPYKEAWPVEEALAYIDRESGRHFDPDVVFHFQKALPRILAIREQYSDRNAVSSLRAEPG